jgi:predicted enzyme related to lactoylglutathione lyase
MFGWTMDLGKDKSDPNGYLHIANGKQYIAGILPDSYRDPNTPPHWMPYFIVPSADEATDKVKELGGQALHESH